MKFLKAIKFQLSLELRNRNFSGMLPFVLISILLINLLFEKVIRDITSQPLLLSAYFENYAIYSYAMLSLIPLLLILNMAKIKNRKESTILVCLLSSMLTFFSYYSNGNLRTTISNLFGFVPMPSGSADWVTIPNFIACRIASGCDPFGRPIVYGTGWKVFFWMGDVQISLLFLAIAVAYIFYEASKFASYLKVNYLVLALLISPSMIFAIERGNSDLFAFAILLLIIRYLPSRIVFNFIGALFLVTLKPFFAAVILKGKPKVSFLLITSPLLFVTYFASMDFSLTKITEARRVTLYPPASQIGADQLPSLVIQSVQNYFNQEDNLWDGSINRFYFSLALGIFLVLICTLIAMSNSFSIELLIEVKRLPITYRNLVHISSFLFILIYISGSQVTYKLWMTYPLLFLTLSLLNRSGNRPQEFLKVFLSAWMIFGCFGVNIWLVRNIGAFCMSVMCAVILLGSYLNNRSKLGS